MPAWTRHSFIINSFMWCRNRGVSIIQNTFQNEMHQRWRYDTVFGNIMDHVYAITFSYFLDYQTFAWHGTVTCRSDFARSLTDSVSVKKSSPPTNCLIPNDRGWGFFLNPFLNPFPNHFYRGQRLALRLKLCRSNVLCLYRLKDIGCC